MSKGNMLDEVERVSPLHQRQGRKWLLSTYIFGVGVAVGVIGRFGSHCWLSVGIVPIIWDMG